MPLRLPSTSSAKPSKSPQSPKRAIKSPSPPLPLAGQIKRPTAHLAARPLPVPPSHLTHVPNDLTDAQMT